VASAAQALAGAGIRCVVSVSVPAHQTMIDIPSLLRADERGVSEVLGAILVFGLLISLVALIQMNAIPNANKEVEYQHSIEVQSDMAKLQEAVSLTAIEGASKSSTVRLGVSYPPRFLFFNPSDVQGQLRTTDESNLTLSNVEGSGSAETLYTGGSYDYSTRMLEYRAGYKRLEGAPTIYREVGISHERYPGGNITSNETFVDGKQITLVTLNGSLQANGVAAQSIETVPISAPARTVAVTNETSDPLEITVPTRLSNETWADVLEPQYTRNGGHIEEQTYTERPDQDNLLTVRLEPGVTYDLRMAQVGVGGNLASQDPAYVTTVGGSRQSVLENGIDRLTVEVRDRYNNPVSGRTVNMTIVGTGSNGYFIDGGGNQVKKITVTTDANGQAPVIYEPPAVGNDRDVDVRVSIKEEPDRDPTVSFDTSDRNNTTFQLTVLDSGGPIGDPPNPSISNIKNKSQGTNIVPILGDPGAAFEIEWEATDPDNPSNNDNFNSYLDTVEIRLVNKTTSRIVDSAKYDVPGQDASGKVTLGESGQHCGSDYKIKVIASDKGGYVRETDQDETASCPSPGPGP